MCSSIANSQPPDVDAQGLASLLPPACVQARVPCATWEDAIGAAVDLLIACGAVPAAYKAAAIERERIYPTGLPTLPYGVALPHADGAVAFSSLALITLHEPVRFAQMGEPELEVPVAIVIALAIRRPQDQVEALAQLAQLVQHGGFLESAVQAASDAELYQAWRTWTAVSSGKE